MLVLTILAFIAIFSLLIVIHELGHFWAAKRAGVKVEEFGFGLPPKLFGIKRGETTYSFNLIPFGGFVRLLGEDSMEGKKSKRSISNQPLRTQAWIIVAGVFMNLLLAFLLLTAGFLYGIEPLIVDSTDFEAGVRDGTVEVQPGLLIVESTSEKFEQGDRILGPSEAGVFQTLEEWTAFEASIQENAQPQMVRLESPSGLVRNVYFGVEDLEQIEFAPLYLNRFVYLESPGSVLASQLQSGDVILRINQQNILNQEDLDAAFVLKSPADFEIFRPTEGLKSMSVYLPNNSPVVGYVYPGSNAEKFGLQTGDQVLKVNAYEVYRAEEISYITEERFSYGATGIVYEVLRGEELLQLDIPFNEDGRVGVALSNMLPYYGNLSLYDSLTLHSLVEVHHVQYGILEAPVVAVKEMWRLGKLTAVMFVEVLGNFVSGQKVPEGVSGPVGIAQMTSVTIQDGGAAVLRFIALLSLSLGVINILPIPALDGGRLLFIAIQAFTGKRPQPHVEGWIHNLGFFFLLLFLIYVTFNDVLNLF